MTLLNKLRTPKFDYLVLLPILGLAFYFAFIPHLNYAYPIHVDEWVHMALARAMLQAGSTTFTEPFTGQGTVQLTTNLETGFQLFWGVFQSISGISWMTIFRYFPSVMFVITVLAVFVLGQREGFGWEAAFFTALIPTTVGILGPGFLVPVAMGLLFTPLILFLAFNFKNVWSYLIIFVFICFLLLIHAPSAIVPIIVTTPYILLNLKGNFKHSLGLAVALLLPFLGVIPWIFTLALSTAKDLFISQSPTELVQLPRIIQTYGYLPVGLSLLGTFLLAIKGGRKNYGLVLGLLILLMMLVTFYSLHYGLPILYERGLMYMMLMIGIVAGVGLAGIKNLGLPAGFNVGTKTRLIIRITGILTCLALIVIALVATIPYRFNTIYYHMIDGEDYQAFTWIRDNVGQDYTTAILDPWKGTAFTAITGKSVYTRIHMAPLNKDKEVYSFLRDGSKDAAFLKRNSISIVYTRVSEDGQDINNDYPSNNPNLVEVAKNIYLLK